MRNPWEEIDLQDYENHMRLESVMQLQALNRLMKGQFARHPAKTVMLLGAAGGNGLEHIDTGRVRKVYAVDINEAYLTACKARHVRLGDILACLRADLAAEAPALPPAELVVADLLVEYIGYGSFRHVIERVEPLWVSCVIQLDSGGRFVSDSPYLHKFDGLDRVHRQIKQEALTAAMAQAGYALTGALPQPLPNGKQLLQLDYEKTG